MLSQKTHSLAQDPSYLATPVTGAHRSWGGFSPRGQPVLPCLVALPLRREACFPVAGSPFLWPGLGSFFGCFFGRPPMTPRGVVWRRCNRPRVRPSAADLVINFWVLCTLLTTLPCQLTKPGGPRKGIEVIFGHRRYDGDRKRFQSNRAGPCDPSLFYGHLIHCIQSLVDLHEKQEYSQLYGSNFEMVPQKTHCMAQDPS